MVSIDVTPHLGSTVTVTITRSILRYNDCPCKPTRRVYFCYEDGVTDRHMTCCVIAYFVNVAGQEMNITLFCCQALQRVRGESLGFLEQHALCYDLCSRQTSMESQELAQTI